MGIVQILGRLGNKSEKTGSILRSAIFPQTLEPAQKLSRLSTSAGVAYDKVYRISAGDGTKPETLENFG